MLSIDESISDWPQNLPDSFTDSSLTTQLSSSAALKEVNSSKKLNNKSGDLVIIYHPSCPHCHKLISPILNLAKLIHQQNVSINIITVNGSKMN